ncbi:MAG: hypothetical protein KGH94_02030 [Candidatus Micrarchaeota archaeon]|nr:hypothetical protein [Candidatus Micrarchaeota archaeon]
MRVNGRGQIALEFIVVYSVVLIVFILVFTVISGQRASILTAQQGSIARIEAQEIAGYIDHAVSAGSGYTTTLALAQGPGTIPYNIYISTSGVVIVNTTYGSQPVSAYAFSDGRNMSINGSLQYGSANTIGVYLVPSYTGVVKISNIGGTIYIDKAPVSNAGLLGSTTLSNAQEGYIPMFGGHSYMVAPDSGTLDSMTNGMSVCAWIYYTSTGSYYMIATKSDGSAGAQFELRITPTNSLQFLSDIGGVYSAATSSSALSPSTWYYVCGVYNGADVYTYVNGTASTPAAASGLINIQSNPLSIAERTGSGSYLYSGLISNVQLYNAPLSATQISGLYGEGIFGAPTQTANLVGWWPLNGNSDDYSGNANNAQAFNVTYSTLASLTVSLYAKNGTRIKSVPVGTVISNGNVNGGRGATRGTSSNGVYTTLLVYNSINPNATIYAYNGNLSNTANLIGWWPLTFGEQGSDGTIYDLGYGGDNAVGPIQWGIFQPPVRFSAATFPGNTAQQSASNGVITVTNAGTLTNITRLKNFTLVTWVKYNGGSSSSCYGIFGSGGISGSGIQLNSKPAGSTCYAAYIGSANVPGNYITPLSSLNWTMVSMTWSGLLNKVYVFENSSVAFSNTVTGSLGITPNSAQYYIGAQGSSGSGAFNGLISNVQLYSKVLSSTQIAQLYSLGPTGLPLAGTGLSGWWPLTGSTVDFSGGNNGTLSYNSIFTLTNYTYPLASSPAYKISTFSGSNEITITGNSAIRSASPFSTSFWFVTYSNPASSFDYYLVDAQTSGDDTYNVQLCGAGQCGGVGPGITGSVGTGAGWLSTGVSYSFNFVPMRLYNLVETFSTTGWSMYLNGVNVNSGTYSGTPKMVGSSDNIWLGGANSAGTYFQGQMEDFRIYNTALTPAQVMQIYQQGPAPQSSVTLSMG